MPGATAREASEQLWLADRLDFLLPDFTRLSWVSHAAREMWAPRFERIQAAWQDIEWLSVADRLRECALLSVAGQVAPRPNPSWLAAGLNAVVWQAHGSAVAPLRRAVNLRRRDNIPGLNVAIGRGDSAQTLKESWLAGLHQEVGRLLGYPRCCRDFYVLVRVDRQCADTLWSMMLASADMRMTDDRHITAGGPIETNVLWRALGLRMIAHLPCKLDCPASRELASAFLAVGIRHGYAPEMHWLHEILSWPVQWSGLHGIAEIKTPVLKLSTRTDATARKYSVSWRADDDRTRPAL
jgi:hypothetical protein